MHESLVLSSLQFIVAHFKETLIKLITFIVRQAHYERNQYITVRPESVEGLNQNFLKYRVAFGGEFRFMPRDFSSPYKCFKFS